MEKIYPVASPSSEVAGQSVYRLPDHIGNGGIFVDTFGSGLGLAYTNLHLKKKVRLVIEQSDWVFGIGFSLKGHSKVRSPAIQGDVPIGGGKSGHFLFPGTMALTEDLSSGQRIKINISFNAKVLSEFAKEDEEAFFPFLQGFKNQIPFSENEKILPQMTQALNQIMNCPFTGKPRALFLESKTLELMAYKLDQMRYKTRSALRQDRLTPNDIEQIRHAAGCLRRDPVNPPDITTLAATAGMSRSKFYRCFKQVLGHSPLDHLRTHRLHLAKHFLTKGRHNVTEAAFAVGYNNVSYFIKIFTAQFGVTPHKIS